MTNPPIPEPTEDGVYPDSPVAELTLERIGAILDSENLQYRIESHDAGEESVTVLRTGFSNTAIFMQLRGETLIIDSIWRGVVPKSEGPKVLQLTNQWNTENYTPTLRFLESGNEGLAVSAVREVHVAKGMSRNQIGAFTMSTLDAIMQAYTYIESQYPQLVTWEEHNHDA